MDEEAQFGIGSGIIKSEASFSVYLKAIVWICAALGSWAALIAVSHLARALIR